MTTTIRTARAMNFNPGPAALPLPVLERAREELIDFASTGLSIMEHSHRGKAYEAVHDEAIALLRELLGISDAYDVLLLQGGASQQFAQLPMNFLGRGLGSGAYVLTGSWSEKAYAEAQIVAAMLGGEAAIAASTSEGKSKQYTRVPAAAELRIPPHAAYVHLTSNETIHGVQFAAEPEADFPEVGETPLFCDMSSDFLWRAFDVNRFGLFYAGAQKNVGPSGVVVVVIRKDLVEAGRKDIPVIFQYRTHAASNSLYNTPPTFGVYLVRGVLQWVKENGGLAQIERWNREKARRLYQTIDAHAGFYRCPVERGSRSAMNVVFRLPSEDLEARFVKQAEQERMIGLKGHRSVGGIRVSSYNAVQLEWVEALCRFMEEFARTNG